VPRVMQTADMRDRETIDPELRLIALVRRSGPLPSPGRAGMSIPAPGGRSAAHICPKGTFET
jgi:hypothetical protein